VARPYPEDLVGEYREQRVRSREERGREVESHRPDHDRSREDEPEPLAHLRERMRVPFGGRLDSARRAHRQQRSEHAEERAGVREVDPAEPARPFSGHRDEHSGERGAPDHPGMEHREVHGERPG